MYTSILVLQALLLPLIKAEQPRMKLDIGWVYGMLTVMLFVVMIIVTILLLKALFLVRAQQLQVLLSIQDVLLHQILQEGCIKIIWTIVMINVWFCLLPTKKPVYRRLWQIV